MKINLLCDGKRDGLTIPPLLKKILKTNVETETKRWADIHLIRGRGYGRKLFFALRENGTEGVVAIVDEDKDQKKERLKELDTARKQAREAGNSRPVAIGMARPHGEAWVLDEPEAVKKVLGIAAETAIPNVKNTHDPKGEIERLFEKQKGDIGLDFHGALLSIAEAIDIQKYRHPDRTGFENFARDLKNEFYPKDSNGLK